MRMGVKKHGSFCSYSRFVPFGYPEPGVPGISVSCEFESGLPLKIIKISENSTVKIIAL